MVKGSEYQVYTGAATVALRWELPHDRIDNGIVIHHVPDGTSKANAVINDVKRAAHKQGYRINTSWLDRWTVRIKWHK